MNITLLLAILGAACSAIGTGLAVAKSYHSRLQEYVLAQTEASKKQYAAERDFNHIRNDLAQLKEGQKLLLEEFDSRIDALEKKQSRLEIIVQVLTVRTTGDGINGIFSATEVRD